MRHPALAGVCSNDGHFQLESKQEDLSLFDCMGYIFSLENNFDFVTGDRAFKDKKGVLFIQK